MYCQDEIKALFKKLKEVKVDRKCDAFVGVQDGSIVAGDVSLQDGAPQ